MAPVQQTFSLIPELPSALHGGEQEQGRVSRPPMTTKQAKKAYKAKNKGPKLCKAEQRRQDLMEQDRIRREFEKERNQARAKAARDKRKEKEDREKAEKKRKGVPLVEVHPSQDTLARFVRRPITPVVGQKPGADLGGLSVRQGRSPRNDEEKTGPPVVFSEEDDSDTTLPAEDEPERPKKRPRVGSSPRSLSTIKNAPHDMFNKSTTKPNANRDTSPVKAEFSHKSLAAVGKEPVSTAASLDPDDPIVEDMVNRQILTESFSADDGLFDDLDFEAMEMQTIAQDATHMKVAVPPPISPNSRLLPGRKQTAVDKNGQVKRPFSPNEVTRALSPKQAFAARSQMAERVEDCETVNPDPRGLPDDNASIRSVMQQTSGSETNAASVALSAPGQETRPVARGSTTRRRLLLLAEQRDRKPLQELPLKQSISSNHEQKEHLHSPAKSEQTQCPEKTPKPARSSPPKGFNKPKAFLSPRTPNMGPPPLPPKFQTPNRSISGNGVNKPKFLPQKPSSFVKPDRRSETSANLVQPEANMPPSSTQLFLLSNADELFPSPSQEVAELLDEPISRFQGSSTRPKSASDALPSLLPSSHTSMTRAELPRSFARKGSSTNHAISRGRPAGDFSPAQAEHREAPNGFAAKPQTHEALNIDMMPPFSTQDFLLSSQDRLELEDEPLPPVVQPQPSNTRELSNALPSPSIPVAQMHRNPRGNHCTTAIVGNHTATKSMASKTDPRPPVRIVQASGATDRGVKQANDTIKTPPGVLSGKKPESHESHLPSENYSARRTRIPKPEVEDLTSSFTDDELAELLSENFEIEQDEPEPAATRFPAEAALQQTPVRTQSSPKPFFTSSGTKEKFILAFEKTRTDTWRNDNARHQGQEELDVLCRQEEEKQQRILLEKLLESEEQFGEETGVASSPAQMKSDHAQSSSAKSNDSTRSQSSTTASKKTRQRTHPHGSYEKMLEMLEKGKVEGESTQEAEVASGRKESHERNGSMEEVIPASQGSDYGDLILDLDDFPDF